MRTPFSACEDYISDCDGHAVLEVIQGSKSERQTQAFDYCNALNSIDRLESENAELRAALKGLVGGIIHPFKFSLNQHEEDAIKAARAAIAKAGGK